MVSPDVVTMDCFQECCQIDIITDGWGWCGLVYLGTQLSLFQKHLQYSVIIGINITITLTQFTIVELDLILLEDQEVLGTDKVSLRYC